MKKLIDFDAIFDEKLAEYMQRNAGKYTEKQWEDIIPKLYRQFGDIVIPAVGASPKGYYAAMSDEELAEALVRHTREGVPVPDFLCRELEARKSCREALIPLLFDEDTALQTLAVNTIGDDERAFPAYFRLLRTGNADENVVEAVGEQLKMRADAAKGEALSCYKEGVRPELMLEILSRCRSRDEEVYSLLLSAFRTEENIPMHASYLAAYGDARALETLLSYIDREDITFLEFQELRYAIEALGGEYTKPRDFSSDPYFQEVMAQSVLPEDGGKGEVN